MDATRLTSETTPKTCGAGAPREENDIIPENTVAIPVTIANNPAKTRLRFIITKIKPFNNAVLSVY